MSRYSGNIPSLDAEEIRLIEECLQEDASRRRSFVPEDPLFILSDDIKCGSLDPNKERKFRLEADYDNRWIEVHALTKEGELLLATHLYRYDEVLESGRKRKYATRMEGGQKIKFTIHFATNAEGERVPLVDISYHETKILRALSLFWRRLKNKLRELPHTIFNQPPVLAFTRGMQERQLLYILPLAFFAVTLATTVLFVSQSRHGVKPSGDLDNQAVSNDSNNGNQAFLEGGGFFWKLLFKRTTATTDAVEQSPGEAHSIKEINAPESKLRGLSAKNIRAYWQLPRRFSTAHAETQLTPYLSLYLERKNIMLDKKVSTDIKQDVATISSSECSGRQ